MALIMNNRPHEDPEHIIMIDDGTGVSIAIPTVIINKEDGDAIKEAVLESEEKNKSPTDTKSFVVLVVDFEMDNPDDRVEYDIWYTSGDLNALNYISSMRSYNEKLGSNALMTPHIIVRTCSYCSETNTDCRKYDEIVYCAGFSYNLGITGRDSLSLGIDEMCIYDICKEEENAAKWWTYMENIIKCEEHKFNQPCISDVQRHLEIDSKKLASCKKKEAEILEKEAENWLASAIPYSPAIIINNKVFRVSFGL